MFADRADQPLLRAFVCTVQAKSAYGANRVAESADRARDELTHLTTDATSTVRVLLASMLVRAEARLGHPDAALEALHRVHAERDRVGDPADVGGLFACSVVGQACFAAGVVGLVAFFDMFVFVAILASAILFAWKEGAFDWER